MSDCFWTDEVGCSESACGGSAGAPATPLVGNHTAVAAYPPRYKSAVAATDQRIYTFGGYIEISGSPGSYEAANDLWQVAAPGGAWSLLGNGGNAVSGHAAACIGETLYYFGGLTPAQTYVDELWAVDLASLVWARGSSGPVARTRPAMAVAGSRLYIYGGYAGALLSDLWQYDTSTGVWTELAASSLPGGRAGHGICAVGGKLYLFGGQTDSGAGADLWEYDILTGSWTELYTTASSPIVYRIDFAYAAIGQYIYIYGGYYNTNMPLADMWEYDTVADAWREVGTGFPAYDCANQSVAFNNALYAFGGLGSSNVATLDTATEFT